MKFTQVQNLEKVQENVKRMVERGEITKSEGIQIILSKTVELLESLKVPEEQSWEREEHGQNFSQNN